MKWKMTHFVLLATQNKRKTLLTKLKTQWNNRYCTKPVKERNDKEWL